MFLPDCKQSIQKSIVVPTNYMEIRMSSRLHLPLPAVRQPAVALALFLLIGGLVVATGSNFWRGGVEPAVTQETGARSVAWYAANIREAREVNRACFGSRNSAEQPTPEDCENSLRALNMSHVSRNYQN